jgi:hypothetical protein
MSNEYQAITQVVETYIDGLHAIDLEKLRAVFHPNCHLYHLEEGVFTDRPREIWLEAFAKRQSAKSLGQPKIGRIAAIDMSDEKTALAKVETTIAPRAFTDYLGLMKIDGRWQIVTKWFRY